MNKEEFIEEVTKLGIQMSEDKMQKLQEFYSMMLEWNEKINLTRITEEKEVYLKHFYDSLTIQKVVNLNKVETLCDVGTGAGFPGIVLKICFTNLKVTLIDSLQKRVNYLQEVIKKLDLKDITAIHTRGEEYKGQFDVVTSRAVANIEKLVNYTMHLVAQEGIFVAMKANVEEELTREVRQKLEKKYTIDQLEKFYLPKENSIRTLVVMRKKSM